MKLSRLLLAALLYALPTVAFAQCSGILPAGYFCGNSTSAGALAAGVPPTALFNRAFGTVNNAVLATNGSAVPAFTTSLPSAVQLAIGSFNSGTSAGTSTFWRGDGTWAIPNWTPSGTGGTARTVTSSLQERGVTPTDYGAIPNDNTQGAVNAAAFANAFAASSNVYCKPSDTYYTQSIVVPVTATNLRGCTFTASGTYGANTAVVSVTSNSNGFIAENLNISVNVAVYTTTNGIAFISSPNAVVRNSSLSGVYPVFIGGASNNARVEDNTFSSGTFGRAIWATSDGGAASIATLSIASPMVVTKTAHGLLANAPVILYSSGALPTGPTAGRTAYVMAAGLTANTFQVSATVGGAAINSSGTQSGTQYYTSNGATGLIISGNTIYKSSGVNSQGIIVIGASGALLTNNIIIGMTNWPVASLLGANNAITNNIAWYAGKEAFHTDSGVGTSIKGNQAIFDATSTDVGISVSSDNGPPAVNTLVTGNTVDSPFGTGIYLVGAIGSSVIGNKIKNANAGNTTISASIALDGTVAAPTQRNFIGQNTIEDTVGNNAYQVGESNYTGAVVPNLNQISPQLGTAGATGYILTSGAATTTMVRAKSSTSSGDTQHGYYFDGSRFALRDTAGGVTSVELFDFDNTQVGSLGGSAVPLMNWGQTTHRWSSRGFGAVYASLGVAGWNWTNITAPGTPAAGTTNVYTDSTRKVLCGKDDAAVVTCIPPGIETAWTAYTPTVTSGSGTFTTVSATGAYKQVGKTVTVRVNVNITTNGTAAGRVEATLPVAVGAGPGTQAISGFNDSTSVILATAIVPAISTTKVLLFTAAGAYPGANGTVLIAQGVYEVP